MNDPASAHQAMDAARAIDAFQPGTPAEAGLADVMGSLITGLHHLAGQHGIDFAGVLAASQEAYARQQASEHAYQAGQDVRVRAGTVLDLYHDGLPPIGVIAAAEDHPDGIRIYAVRFPGDDATVPFRADEIEPAPAFRPVQLSDGLAVTTLQIAEVLITDIAARVHLSELHSAEPHPVLISDRDLLAQAIGAVRGVSAGEVLRGFDPQITTSAEDLRAIAAADKLGSQHGRAGTGPFWDPGMDGDAEARLMTALGETGPTTRANHPRRLAMLDAYHDAYNAVRTPGQPTPAATDALAEGAPAHLAGRDFPHSPCRTTQPVPSPGSPGPATAPGRASRLSPGSGGKSR